MTESHTGHADRGSMVECLSVWLVLGNSQRKAERSRRTRQRKEDLMSDTDELQHERFAAPLATAESGAGRLIIQGVAVIERNSDLVSQGVDTIEQTPHTFTEGLIRLNKRHTPSPKVLIPSSATPKGRISPAMHYRGFSERLLPDPPVEAPRSPASKTLPPL